MYETYWGLREKPFENAPDPRFIYYSYEHREAINRLIYAVEERKGAAMLTGDYGCGKTVTSRLLFEKLPDDKYEIALVTNPFLSPTALLREICFQLGIKSSVRSPKTHLLENLNERLYENMDKHKDTVIIIDEAQVIRDPMTFEELRLLLNFQLNDRFLMTLILIGQPELRGMINELKQLKQRIATRYHLDPLNKEDTENYIIHRLRIAGATRKIFSNNSINLIWESSKGVPRVINTICDMCLLLGFSKKLNEISGEMVREVVYDLEG
ncbi:MAG: ExeA family protein [Candidatus Aminicenantia bacterium]